MWARSSIQTHLPTDRDRPYPDFYSPLANCHRHERADSDEHNCTHIHTQSSSLWA